MNIENDVILITAHTPDLKRKECLRNLLASINKEKFDIVVSANSELPGEIYEVADFIIYDKLNFLIHDFDKKISIWWGNDDFRVQTTELKSFNHIVAAQTLITNGLNWCKNKGYKKLHFLEYDSLILDDSIFFENSEILNNSTMVWYSHPADHGLFSSYSINLERIPYFWLDLSFKKLWKFMDSDSDKIIESYGMSLIESTRDTTERNFSLYSQRVKSNLFNTDCTEDWAVVVGKNGKFFSFTLNDNRELMKVLYILNDQKIHTVSCPKSCWNLLELGEISEIHNIKILVDGNLKREYDFSKIDKTKFTEKNFLR